MLLKYRMGIDLGTNSAALVAVELDDDKLARQIIYHEAILFSEPLENKQGTLTPKAQDRRLARQQRKQLQRKKRRIKHLAFLAPLLDIQPNQSLRREHSQLEKNITVPSIILLRALAATNKIELYELLLVFIKMIKKRGYAGGFRVQTQGSDTGKVQTGANQLTQYLKGKTLGQYILKRVKEGKPARLRMDDYPDTENLYALRVHVEDEFNQIWETQSQFHDILSSTAIEPLTGEELPLKTIFHSALFYQRPLKSFSQSIGNCQLETNLPRSPKAHPASQAFRIEKMLNDLRWGQKKYNENKLTKQQKNILRELLNKQAEVSFSSVYKAFEKAGCSPETAMKFSINRAQKESFKGNTTNAGFRTLGKGLLEHWQDLEEITQTQVINFLAELTSAEQLNDNNWHLNFKKISAKANDNSKKSFRTFAPEMILFINNIIDSGKFNRLSSMKHFESGRAKYSIKSLQKLTAYMSEYACDEYETVKELYPRNTTAHEYDLLLDAHDKTGNAVVDVALGQLKHIINACVRELGTPSEIIVEVARELGKGPTARNDIEKKQRKFESIRKKAKETLEIHNIPSTNTNILKYRLWQDQDGKCPYCIKPNIGIEHLSDGSVNFEHIIPRSQSKVGRKYNEIVLAHRSCNDKKGNSLPLLSPLAKDSHARGAIAEMAERLYKKGHKRKAMLLRLDDPTLVEEDDILTNFSSWRIQDTAWMSKLTHQWLVSIVEKPSHVYITKGGITSMMRWQLGLETVIPELRFAEGLRIFDKNKNPLDEEIYKKWKYVFEGHPPSHRTTTNEIPQLDKRIDHRHHLIDALSIALCDRSITQRATKNFKIEHEKELKKNRSLKPGKIKRMMREAAMKSINSPIGWRDQALKAFADEVCQLQHRPDHYLNKRFYKDTAYGKVVEDGKARLIIRKPLRDLSDKNADKVRTNLNAIVSDITRNHLLKEFNQRVASGVPIENALTNPPIMQAMYGEEKPILRVKCYFDLGADDARKIKFNGVRQTGFKHLISDGNAYLKVIINEYGEVDKEQSHPVALIDAINIQEKPTSNEMRFYKGDTVKHLVSQKRYVIKQIKAMAGGTLVLIPIMETRPVKQLSAKDGLKNISLKKLITLVIEEREYVRQPYSID